MEIKLLDDGTMELGNFSALQAYKVARKLEKDGIDFYEKAKANVNDKKISNALQFLIDSEKKHLAFFEERIEEEQKRVEDGFEADDVADFLDSNIFPDSRLWNDLFKDTLQVSRVLTFGAKIEKSSITFYQAMLNHVSDKEAHKALSDIISEEEDHYNSLQQFIV